MKLNKAAFCCLAVISAFASYAADKSSTKNTKDPRQTATLEVDAFSKRMQASDPNYARKEPRLIAAVPYLTANYPPNQWTERVEFLYQSLGVMDEAMDKLNPDAIWSAYYAEENEKRKAAVAAEPGADSFSIMNPRLRELRAAQAKGDMSLLEQSGRQLAVIYSYRPYDKSAIEIARYHLDLACQLTKGAISQVQMDAMWAIKTAQAEAARLDQRDYAARQQLAIERQAIAEEEAMQARGIAAALQEAGRSLRRNAPRPTLMCVTGALGTTTCQ